MNRISLLFGIVGLAAIGALVVRVGPGEVGTSVAAVGWAGFLAATAFRLLPVLRPFPCRHPRSRTCR